MNQSFINKIELKKKIHSERRQHLAVASSLVVSVHLTLKLAKAKKSRMILSSLGYKVNFVCQGAFK